MLCAGFGTSDAKLVEVLLSYGADANSTTGCFPNTTPLLTALTSSHWDVASVLLNHGADPNATGGSESTPLTMTAGTTNAAMVAELLDHGALPNVMDKYGKTPLIDAATYDRTKVVTVLLDHGAAANIKGKGGIAALGATKNIQIIDLLISHGANVDDAIPVWFGKNIKLPARQQALIKAIVTGSVKDAETAVAHGADLNYRYDNGTTALNIAIFFQRPTVVDWMLAHGVNANASDDDGDTALHLAAMSPGNTEVRLRIVQSLLNNGGAVDAADQLGMTPLHIAAGEFDREVAKLLISKGADPLRRTKNGLTPEQMAERSHYGTGLIGSQTGEDVEQKAAIVEFLHEAVQKRNLTK
jgi:uncharacterized protein